MYPADWIEALHARHPSPVVRLAPLLLAGAPYVNQRWSTYQIPDHLPAIVDFAQTSRRVLPLTWRATTGGLTVRLLRSMVDTGGLRRGSPWALLCDVEGAGEQVIWRGWLDLWSCSRAGGSDHVDLELRDLTSLQCRSTSTATELDLFTSAGSTTTLTANYTAGDGTLTVASTANLEARDPTGAGVDGLVLVTPTTGDPFFFRWTSKTATVLTGGGSNELGTTRVDAVIGDTVTEYVLLEDHPSTVLEEVLTSAVGAELPGLWAMLLPTTVVDVADMRNQKARYDASGGSECAFWTASAKTWEALQTWAAAVGWYVTLRHGRITVRTLPSVTTDLIDEPTHDADHTIRTADLLTRDGRIVQMSVTGWGREWRLDYQRIVLSTPTASIVSSTAAMRGMQARQTYAIDLSASGGAMPANGGPGIYSNVSNTGGEIVERLQPWTIRAPQVVRLKVAGPHPEYTLGDIVDLPDLGLPSGEGGTLAGTQGAIMSVAPDWLGWSCAIEVWIPAQVQAYAAGEPQDPGA